MWETWATLAIVLGVIAGCFAIATLLAFFGEEDHDPLAGVSLLITILLAAGTAVAGVTANNAAIDQLREAMASSTYPPPTTIDSGTDITYLLDTCVLRYRVSQDDGVVKLKLIISSEVFHEVTADAVQRAVDGCSNKSPQ